MRHVDIFERLPNGAPNWIESVDGLAEAYQRIRELDRLAQRRYFIYDESTGTFEDVSHHTEEKLS